MAKLRKALKEDPSWYCNVMDEGVSHELANQIAARIMKHCFNVETAR